MPYLLLPLLLLLLLLLLRASSGGWPVQGNVLAHGPLAHTRPHAHPRHAQSSELTPDEPTALLARLVRAHGPAL
jgi:hypothetical protein